MVRTRDTAGVKVAGAKAVRKLPPASSSVTSSSGEKNKYSGGNPYCPRETPEWQKPITNFFVPSGSSSKQEDGKADDEKTESKDDADVEKTEPKDDCNGDGPSSTTTNENEETVEDAED